MKRSYSKKKEENDDVAENSASGDSNQTIIEIESSPPPPPPPTRKPRRRLPARKPYLQKHLNMAEARREIVAALKHHRATTNQPQQQPIIEPLRLDFSKIDASASNSSLQSMYPYANRSWICPYCFSPWPAVMLTPPPPPPDAGFHDYEVPWMGLGLKLDVEEFIGKPYKVYIDGAPPFEYDEEEIGSPFNDEMVEFPPWLIDEESGCGVEKQCVVDLQQDSSLPCLEIEEIDGVDGDWLN